MAWPRTVEIVVGRVRVVARGRWPPGPAGPRTSAAPGRARRAAGRPTPAPATWSSSCSHSATISRLPTAWPCRSPLLTKRCWTHLGPGLAPLVVAAQRGQRLAQVAGRQHAQLGAQPAAGAAVVGDGDHRGQVAGDPAQRGQRGGQPVAAAEGDDLRRHPGAAARERRQTAPAPPPSRHDHSRPMSRCTVTVSTPSAASRAASRSDIATLRCLPPVQPTAMVTYRLPSRR